MIKDCDYIRTFDNNFYIVKGFSHPKEELYTTLVFEVTPNGDRTNSNGLSYKKVIEDKIRMVPKRNIAQIFKPEKAKVKRTLKDEWQKIYKYFLKIGIKDENIGVFGSSLIGFPIVKDVDFIIYGLENLERLRQNMSKLKRELGFSDITEEHINYQKHKYSKFHNPTHTNFTKTLRNKWSSIQIRPGLLLTVRFGFKGRKCPKELKFFPTTKGEKVTQKGVVTDTRYVDYTPRAFQIETANECKLWIKTLYWAYQSCVKEGDNVLINGIKIDAGIIGLIDQNNGVKIIK